MNLSDHFTLEELVASDTAIRKSIDNTPDPEVLACLGVLAQGLERVRAVLGCPLRISSGYRSPKLNAAVGGKIKPPSAHTLGLAADFTAPEFGTPLEVCRAIAARVADIHFDQLIQEGTWTHVGFADDKPPRGEVLTAHFSGGRAAYTRGLT